jgi:hypothetical protein
VPNWFWWRPPSVAFYSDIKSWATLGGCESSWSRCEYSEGAWFGSPYTLAPVIDEGVSCLSFHLEDEEQLVP